MSTPKVPTPIVDKNGVATIRHKNVEQAPIPNERVAGAPSVPQGVGYDPKDKPYGHFNRKEAEAGLIAGKVNDNPMENLENWGTFGSEMSGEFGKLLAPGDNPKVNIYYSEGVPVVEVTYQGDPARALLLGEGVDKPTDEQLTEMREYLDEYSDDLDAMLTSYGIVAINTFNNEQTWGIVFPLDTPEDITSWSDIGEQIHEEGTSGQIAAFFEGKDCFLRDYIREEIGLP